MKYGIRTRFLILGFLVLFPLSSHSQLDISDKSLLLNMDYYVTDDSVKNESTAHLTFKFNREAGRYRLVNDGDAKLTIDFMDAYATKATRIDSVSSPFLNCRLSEAEDTLAAYEGMAPKAVQVLRVDLALKKELAADVVVTHSSKYEYVNILAVHPKSASPSGRNGSQTKWSTYLIVGGSVALIATGIYLLVKNTSSDKKTDVIYEK